MTSPNGQSHLMSDSFIFDIDSDGNLSCELEDLQIIDDFTAILSIEGYVQPMTITIDSVNNTEETIQDFILENY